MPKELIMKYLLLALLAIANTAQAETRLFAETQIVHMVKHGVYSQRFPTGEYPFIGRVGIEHERGRFTYSLSYIHRSNADVWGRDEYNYNGVSIGIKIAHRIR